MTSFSIPLSPTHEAICLSKSTAQTEPGKAFSQRTVSVWNYLPADTVDFKSLKSFKRTVKLVECVDLSSFLKCFD